MVTEKPRIFDYNDYRTYLKDFYQWNKKRDASFSLRYFSNQAGVKSYNYLKLIMDGQRRLTPTFFEPFCNALKLDSAERNYFEGLISFTDEKNTDAKSSLLNDLLRLRTQSSLLLMREDQIHLLQEWFYVPLIELTQVEGFSSDPSWIAARLRLDLRTVKKAIKDLIAANLIEEKGGTLIKKNRVADTRDECPSIEVQRYHSENLQIAARKIFEQPVSDREFGSITFSVDSKKHQKIKAKLKEFRRELFDLLDEPSSTGSDVYQLGFQFFRLTEPEPKASPVPKDGEGAV